MGIRLIRNLIRQSEQKAALDLHVTPTMLGPFLLAAYLELTVGCPVLESCRVPLLAQ